MTYIYHYHSPLGGITISSNGKELTGLWFDGQKYFKDTLLKDCVEKNLPVFEETKRWLAIYFDGKALFVLRFYLQSRHMSLSVHRES